MVECNTFMYNHALYICQNTRTRTCTILIHRYTRVPGQRIARGDVHDVLHHVRSVYGVVVGVGQVALLHLGDEAQEHLFVDIEVLEEMQGVEQVEAEHGQGLLVADFVQLEDVKLLPRCELGQALEHRVAREKLRHGRKMDYPLFGGGQGRTHAAVAVIALPSIHVRKVIVITFIIFIPIIVIVIVMMTGFAFATIDYALCLLCFSLNLCLRQSQIIVRQESDGEGKETVYTHEYDIERVCIFNNSYACAMIHAYLFICGKGL